MITKSKLRNVGSAFGWAFFKVLLPFGAMADTVRLGRKEVERTKADIDVLRRMGAQAKASLRSHVKTHRTPTDGSFAMEMANRRPGALSRQELIQVFLRKKRVAIGAAAFFSMLSLYGIVNGVRDASGVGVGLGLSALFISQPILFLVALNAQLRTWQLCTGRLSKAEKGGLKDFFAESPGWWLQTFNPEFKSTPWTERHDGA